MFYSLSLLQVVEVTHRLDGVKELVQSGLIIWGVLEMRLPLLTAQTLAGVFITVLTVKMLELVVMDQSHSHVSSCYGEKLRMHIIVGVTTCAFVLYFQLYVSKERFDWLGDLMRDRVALKCAMAMPGALCVMTFSMLRMLQWLVSRLVSMV